ncbi:guanine nucleotide-binding protein g(o) subunit alpha [Anaeramoeba flamelloides]|uniref:Guanine nucleotide-binding protein g(O) subunit alpha n=1 Tax=Anaeramoeba flamelloides TaxID=1746091 RepID=A0AAV7ZSR9_9EUKA|nr:guanine nucleotide-binding protein g(o) subunit alpha [Anaeramoeba flamelloides]KAJ6233344.1 guanine nucleotide-binding protein g(o) subunit alpha [Anaeramoeba flamelloides]
MGNRPDYNHNHSSSKKKKKNQKKEKKEKINLKDHLNQVKILILGAGDSGKSTFLKQVQILYKNGFTNDDKSLFASSIRQNILEHMTELVQGVERFGIKLDDDNQEIAENLLENGSLIQGQIPSYLCDDLIRLWDDPGIKKVYTKRSELQIPENAGYYFDKIEEISQENYFPSDSDILNCRIPTVGVKVMNFEIEGIPWKIVDVGGQRSERRKWINQFSDVTLLLYVVSTSGYTQLLYEDENINRLKESFELYKKTIKSTHFKKKNCIILLNKIDLMKKKIKKKDLKICFPKYKGGCDFNKAIEYIENLYIKTGKNKKRKIFTIRTVGTNTPDIESVFRLVSLAIDDYVIKNRGKL